MHEHTHTHTRTRPCAYVRARTLAARESRQNIPGGVDPILCSDECRRRVPFLTVLGERPSERASERERERERKRERARESERGTPGRERCVARSLLTAPFLKCVLCYPRIPAASCLLPSPTPPACRIRPRSSSAHPDAHHSLKHTPTHPASSAPDAHPPGDCNLTDIDRPRGCNDIEKKLAPKTEISTGSLQCWSPAWWGRP